MAISILIILVVFMALGLYQGLKTTHYKIANPKINTPLRFALISDLHSHTWGEGQQKLIRIVKKAAPDGILLAGDLEDPNGDPLAAYTLVKGISPLAPCYYVTGSHDMLTWDLQSVLDRMTAAGAVPLREERVNLTLKGSPMAISGVDEPFMAYIQGKATTKIQQADFYLHMLEDLEPLSKDTFNLLIAHRPEFFDAYSHMGFDLAVTGHAHGGQVRIPFILNGLYAPGQGFFPKFASGLYKKNGFTMIVSRGLHFSWIRPRFFNRPEVVIIDLLPKE